MSSRIVVSGYAVRHPVGGNLWAHLQYVAGLERLGHDVWYLEGAGWDDSCYDPRIRTMTSDPSFGLRVVQQTLVRLGLGGRVGYRDLSGIWHGMSAADVSEITRDADLYLDVGGTTFLPEARRSRSRAYIDMDPVFTQFGEFGHQQLDEFEFHFTYGSNIGREGCSVPTRGYIWRPLRPPVLVDLWERAPEVASGSVWTTVANWSAYGGFESDGVCYGQKDVEFMKLVDLPRRTINPLGLSAAGDSVPLDALAENGWLLFDSETVATDPWRYRDFIWGSRGEFSVAKNAYVRTACGWLSDRTAAYLASGRPAVVQETGIDDELSAGRGMLTFRTGDDAIAALEKAESDYESHRAAALELARKFLDARTVLAGLIVECGL